MKIVENERRRRENDRDSADAERLHATRCRERITEIQLRGDEQINDLEKRIADIRTRLLSDTRQEEQNVARHLARADKMDAGIAGRSGKAGIEGGQVVNR